MEVLERLSGDPRALVELYLNYDCDRTALENIYQKYVLAEVRPCSFCVLIQVVLSNNCRDILVCRWL